MSLEHVAQELRAALTKLRSEQSRITAHIAALERVLTDLGVSHRGPGRPRGTGRNVVAVSGSGSRPRKKPNWTPEMKAAARERMKKFWAGRRGGKGQSSKAQSAKSKA